MTANNELTGMDIELPGCRSFNLPNDTVSYIYMHLSVAKFIPNFDYKDLGRFIGGPLLN